MHKTGPRLETIWCHNIHIVFIYVPTSGAALTHQRGHVSSVHLPCGDLLLCRGHRAHIEGVRAADGPGPDYPWQRYRAMLHATHPIELLLQDGGPGTREGERDRKWTLKRTLDEGLQNNYNRPKIRQT